MDDKILLGTKPYRKVPTKPFQSAASAKDFIRKYGLEGASVVASGSGWVVDATGVEKAQHMSDRFQTFGEEEENREELASDAYAEYSRVMQDDVSRVSDTKKEILERELEHRGSPLQSMGVIKDNAFESNIVNKEETYKAHRSEKREQNTSPKEQEALTRKQEEAMWNSYELSKAEEDHAYAQVKREDEDDFMRSSHEEELMWNSYNSSKDEEDYANKRIRREEDHAYGQVKREDEDAFMKETHEDYFKKKNKTNLPAQVSNPLARAKEPLSGGWLPREEEGGALSNFGGETLQAGGDLSAFSRKEEPLEGDWIPRKERGGGLTHLDGETFEVNDPHPITGRKEAEGDVSGISALLAEIKNNTVATNNNTKALGSASKAKAATAGDNDGDGGDDGDGSGKGGSGKGKRGGFSLLGASRGILKKSLAAPTALLGGVGYAVHLAANQQEYEEVNSAQGGITQSKYANLIRSMGVGQERGNSLVQSAANSVNSIQQDPSSLGSMLSRTVTADALGGGEGVDTNALVQMSMAGDKQGMINYFSKYLKEGGAASAAAVWGMEDAVNLRGNAEDDGTGRNFDAPKDLLTAKYKLLGSKNDALMGDIEKASKGAAESVTLFAHATDKVTKLFEKLGSDMEDKLADKAKEHMNEGLTAEQIAKAEPISPERKKELVAKMMEKKKGQDQVEGEIDKLLEGSELGKDGKYSPEVLKKLDALTAKKLNVLGDYSKDLPANEKYFFEKGEQFVPPPPSERPKQKPKLPTGNQLPPNTIRDQYIKARLAEGQSDDIIALQVGQMQTESAFNPRGFDYLDTNYGFWKKHRNSEWSKNNPKATFDKKMAEFRKSGDAKGAANYIYADRIASGEYSQDEAFNYRGRGLIQLFGKGNYKAAHKYLNSDKAKVRLRGTKFEGKDIDLMNNRELANDPELAQEIAYWFMNKPKGTVQKYKEGGLVNATNNVVGTKDKGEVSKRSENMRDALPIIQEHRKRGGYAQSGGAGNVSDANNIYKPLEDSYDPVAPLNTQPTPLLTSAYNRGNQSGGGTKDINVHVTGDVRIPTGERFPLVETGETRKVFA